MTCGIYKLTFSNGQFYIGKSINIEKRWLQHFDKMHKGTAAALIQQQYARHGLPKTEIIYECSEDHIDLVEESLIFRLCPPLNTTYTRDRLRTEDKTLANVDLHPFLTQTTLEHLSEIVKLRAHNSNLCETVNTLVNIGERLHQQRSDEELKADVAKRIRMLEEKVISRALEAANSNRIVADLQAALEYERRPWWQKWF